jgi:hypothetical protein
MNIQRIGGIGSLVAALLFFFAIAAFFLLFPRFGHIGLKDWGDLVKVMAGQALSPGTFLLYNMHLFFWVICFVPLMLALRERLEPGALNLMQIALIGTSISSALWLAAGTIGIKAGFSIANANDISAFRSYLGIYGGLLLAGDFVFGWIILMVGCAGLNTAKLPRILSWLLIVEGIIFIGNLTQDLSTLVGTVLGIITQIWLGIVLLTEKSDVGKTAI